MTTLVQMFAKGIVVKCPPFAQECLKWFWKQNQGWGEDDDERMKGIVARSPHANALLPWLSGYFSPRECPRHWRYCESWAFQTLPLLLHRKGIPAAAKGQLPGWLVVYNVESTGQMRRWLNWGQSGPSLPLPPPVSTRSRLSRMLRSRRWLFYRLLPLWLPQVFNQALRSYVSSALVLAVYGQSSKPGLRGNRPLPTAQEHVELSGQGSISLEYQTYNSAHLYDTLVTGMAARGSICLASTLFREVHPSITHISRKGSIFFGIQISASCASLWEKPKNNF